MNSTPVLILPGWMNSGPAHWQSRWESLHGYQRVEQSNWQRPLRGDWIARLEEVLLQCTKPAVLVAHSLGCVHAAAWASHSKNVTRVKAALLVAPADVDRADVRDIFPSWSPMSMRKLPFKTVVLASSDDPFCELSRAKEFASAWGSDFISVGMRGHVNAQSGLGDWPAGHAQVKRLAA
jgi:uncharacterized protein